jgi:hypothetical protein
LFVLLGDFFDQMRIWEDKTRKPLSKILPHDGEAVSAVAFLSAPDRPDDHTILTAVQILFLLLHCPLPFMWFTAETG